MANTDVILTAVDSALWETNIWQISVVEGDSFTVSSSGGRVNIFLSPALISILSPQPSGIVSIDDGSIVSFTFQTSASGAYCISYGPDDILESDFPTEESLVVVLRPNLAASSVSGPMNTPEGNN